jgi:hypothetical protein
LFILTFLNGNYAVLLVSLNRESADFHHTFGAARSLDARSRTTEKMGEVLGFACYTILCMTDILALIDAEIASLQQARALITGASVRRKPGRPVGTGKKKRKLSPEGRARIAAAVKARWAAQKKSAKETAPPAKKQKMSAEARNRIAAAQKKRWAAIRAGKKAVKPSPAKKAAKKAPANEAVPAKKAAPKKAPAAKAKEVVSQKATPATAEAATS